MFKSFWTVIFQNIIEKTKRKHHGTVDKHSSEQQFIHFHPCSRTFTHVHPCSLKFTHVHSRSPTSPMFTHSYSCSLTFTRVHSYSPMFTHVHSCLLTFTHVHPRSSKFTHVRSRSPMFTLMFTHVHSHVHSCSILSYIAACWFCLRSKSYSCTPSSLVNMKGISEFWSYIMPHM